jgi:hypothetical protein
MRKHFRCLAILRLRPSAPALLVLAQLAVTGARGEPIIWTGPTTNFTKAAFADPTQPANQDRITPNVWITRGSSQGIYNAKTESFFSHFFSPQGTEWATGTTANYSSLTYSDWNTWAKLDNGGPPSTVGINAVVHLITDDIYIDIRFTSWSAGGSGGGFSYDRSTPPLPPSPPQILSVQLTGNNFTMSFLTVSNQSYTVQANLDLTTTNWFDCTNFTGNGLVMQVTVLASNGVPLQVFRVKQP